MRIRCIPFILILLLLCSCSRNNSEEVEHLKESVENYTNKFTYMEQEINLFKETNNKLEIENSNLRSENSELKNRNSTLERNMEYSRDLKDDSVFSWVYNSDWNNIKIKYDHDKSEIEIPSGRLAPYTFIGIIRKGWEPEAMEEGICNYEFIQNDVTYKIEVFKEHVFRYQDQFYYCDGNLFDLYESFVPVSFKWLKTDNIFNLIYHSKIINLENSYFIITDRTKSIAEFIASFQAVASPSRSNIGKLHDVIKCYNHGEVITITTYDNYLSITYKNATTWHKGTDEYRQPYGVVSIINAG